MSVEKRKERRRLGAMKGQLKVPADFDRMEQEAIRKLFENEADPTAENARKPPAKP